MTYDKLENLEKYLPDKYKKIIMEFVRKINNSLEEGVYPLKENDIYANIMVYPTKLKENCTIEVHDIYCDIQFSIEGMEGISIFEKEKMFGNGGS